MLWSMMNGEKSMIAIIKIDGEMQREIEIVLSNYKNSNDE